MECQNRSDKYIWSPHDAYFYKGLSELIVDIDRLIYLSLEKIRKDFVFINLNTDSLSEFINRDNEWLSAVKGKQVVLIAARKSEALANYWYYNSNIRGVVYAGLSRDIRKELAYVINGRFLRKDIKKDKITIKITGNGRIKETDIGYNLKEVDDYNKIEDLINIKIEDEITKYLDNSFKREIDLLNLKDKYYKEFKRVKENIKYDVEAKITLNKNGSIYEVVYD